MITSSRRRQRLNLPHEEEEEPVLYNQQHLEGLVLGAMRGPLRWVLWDVKDTLLKVRFSVGEQYCKEAERLGLKLDPAEVNTAFRQVYQNYSRSFPNYGISQGLTGQAWWTRVVWDTLSQCKVQDPALLNEMADKLYHAFCNAENWEVFPDSVRTLESCSSLGLKLGVVSNFDSRLKFVLRSCGLLTHFNFLITSEEAGVAKPSPAIFKQALQKCETTADCIAHVGDHFVKDYISPRSMGIHGFLLDRHNKHNQDDVPPEHRLVSLDELPARLQKLIH